MRCETYVLVMHGTEVSFDVVSYITLICLLTLQLKNLQLQIHSMIFLVKTAMFLKEKNSLEFILYKDEQIYNFYTQNSL